MGTGGEVAPQAQPVQTGDTAVDKYAQDLSQYNNQLNDWLASNMDLNISQWQQALNNIDDIELRDQTKERIQQVNSGFAKASNIITTASDLASKAQAIYSNDNIRAMKEQTMAKGFSPAKANVAVAFRAMKDKALLSAEIMKVQSEYNNTLAQLETQRTQLEDSIRASGIENDKWIIDRKNDIVKQIQALRENYQAQVIANTNNYVMKPMLDIMSTTRQAQLNTLAEKYADQYNNSSPERKIIAASTMFGTDWAYVDNDIAAKASNMTFGQLLTYA